MFMNEYHTYKNSRWLLAITLNLHIRRSSILAKKVVGNCEVEYCVENGEESENSWLTSMQFLG